MKEDKFIAINTACWKEFEELLKIFKSKKLSQIDNITLERFLFLYNNISGHLSYAKTKYPHASVTTYLNHTVSTAHAYVYSVKPNRSGWLLRFLTHTFPLLIKKSWLPLTISFVLFLIGFLTSFIITLQNPDHFSAFASGDIKNYVNQYTNEGVEMNYPVASSTIMQNNIKVGFSAFVAGISLCLGTIWIMLNNGLSIGTMSALVYHNGNSLGLWSFVAPHGSLELPAIFICGCAGLKIGYALINPGPYTRKDALIKQGKEAVQLVAGATLMFIVAAIIEGFFSPTAISPAIKFTFAAISFSALIFYFIFFGIKASSSASIKDTY